MLRVAHEAAVCYARDNALSERSSMDFKKQTINRALQLLKWLLDASPSLTGWKNNSAAKLKQLDDSFEITVVKMIDGSFWKRQLSGWKEVGAAMVALCVLIRGRDESEPFGLLDCVLYVVDRCKMENDDLHKRMLERELRVPLMDGEPMPTLESVERRDVAAEAKWRTMLAFLKDNDLEFKIREVIETLDHAVYSGTPPRDVLEMLKKLPKPPGYKTLEERQEEERLMRARELAEDEDF